MKEKIRTQTMSSCICVLCKILGGCHGDKKIFQQFIIIRSDITWVHSQSINQHTEIRGFSYEEEKDLSTIRSTRQLLEKKYIRA